jgi:hypothetical protein
MNGATSDPRVGDMEPTVTSQHPSTTTRLILEGARDRR